LIPLKKMQKQLIVPLSGRGERLDKFLRDNLAEISRTKLHLLIERGMILINGAAKRPSYRLKENEAIIINIEEEKKEILKPFQLSVKIIYEDEDIIIVEKPTAISVHPPSAGVDNALVNALLYMGKKLSAINPQRPGVVHRLDKETSGVMVLAKNDRSHLGLIRQFASRKVKKEYLAIGWGEAKESLTVDLPLARDKKNRLKMRISFLGAKAAYTYIEIKQRLKGATLFLLKPVTGRMHQLRVHLKFLGFPIVGDKKYGIKDDYDELFLHAHKLGIYHPRTNEFMEFLSPVPERFEKFINTHR
jgi:23S rRNA pseudouridine1911/1915/1917 synthase